MSADGTLVSSVEFGAIWIERDGESVRVDADEVMPLVRNLLVHHDALADAADAS